ncbi:MAG: hypothetical protein C5B48_06405 [Candidatus Rokuibacteriota bacterium]|nr:MAG: hypothetical protein C5B48_06405 [Candidatus Rokubacteria bacterium]
MIRVFIVYEREPDPERYAQHVEIARKVPGATFRHGKVFGNPFAEPEFAHYAEFEFADRDSFKQGAASPEFQRSGEDVMEMGIPFKVHFADVE